MSRTAMVKKADRMFSNYIRERDKHCVICGTRDRLQAGHLLTRSKYSVRWVPLNGHAQCAGCNLRHEHQPEIYTQWFIRNYGLDVYYELCQRGNRLVKLKASDLEEIAEEYSEAHHLLSMGLDGKVVERGVISFINVVMERARA